MRLAILTAAAAALLAGCGPNTQFSETERTVFGAGVGAAVADATDNSVAAGAAIGGLAGAASDDGAIFR